MKLSHIELGPFELYSIETGRFRLDGGAMFGVVPKTLWSKRIAPDEKNRIPMAMRCLLIRSQNTGRVYLVDNGIGTKFTEKFEHIYGVDHHHSSLADSLEKHGFQTGDVTDLIFTHLHFDHCGGTTAYDENEELFHVFDGAAYHVTKPQMETAQHPNAREKASFLPDNIQPISNYEHLNLIDGHHQFEEGLENYLVNGHTLGQQLIKIEAAGNTLIFGGDLLPTAHHVPLPWVMAFDMYPSETLKEKKEFLNLAAEHEWYIFMEHDADNELISIQRNGKRFEAETGLTLQNLG